MRHGILFAGIFAVVGVSVDAQQASFDPAGLGEPGDLDDVTFDPSFLEVVDALEEGLDSPSHPPSWVFRSNQAATAGLQWDPENDSIFSVSVGLDRMELFWVRRSEDADANINALFPNGDTTHLIMVGGVAVGLNHTAWLRTIALASVTVRFDEVEVPSIDRVQIQGGTAQTSAVWFRYHGGWTAGMKQFKVIPVTTAEGTVSVTFTEIDPQFFVRTSETAEIIARLIIGDEDFCQIATDHLLFTDCGDFLGGAPRRSMTTLDPNDLITQHPEGSDVDCDLLLRLDNAADRLERDAERSRCIQDLDEWTFGSILGVVACCGTGAVVCPPHGCAFGAVGCGILGGAGMTDSYFSCTEAAHFDYMAARRRAFRDYLICCGDGGTCNPGLGTAP